MSDGVLVNVTYRLRLSPRKMQALVPDHPPKTSDDDDSFWVALEEAVKDGLPDLLELAVDEPEVEAT